MFFFKVTEDISLRLLEERHAEALFTLIEHNRAFLEKWQPYLGDIKTVEAARGLIKSGLQIMLKNESFFAGIWFNAELAGFLALEDLNLRARNAKIGYWLGERFQGKGLVTNSCQALIDYAFNELQLYNGPIKLDRGIGWCKVYNKEHDNHPKTLYANF